MAVVLKNPNEPPVSPDSAGWSSALLKSTNPKSTPLPKLTKLVDPTKLTESKVQRLLSAYFDWFRSTMILNSCLFSWESDMLVISRSGYIAEIEIKLSLSDWNADRLKPKWTASDRHKIARFYYCVPYELKFKIPKWVPATTGILSVENAGGVNGIFPVRGASIVSKYKLTDAEWDRIGRMMYCRYWKLRQRQ